MLAHLKERNESAGALLVLKRLAQLTPNERYLRREIGVCLFQAYPDRPRLETFVSKSELTDDRPILEALEFIEHCLAFDAGNYAYDSEMGMGKVTDLDLMVDKLSVDFGKDKPVTYHLGAAFKHLTAVSQEHFLIRKQTDSEGLRQIAVQDPLELFRSLLKSFDRPLKPREIKTYLEGIVSEGEWEGFWNKVRKLAASEPNIRALTKPERSFQWVEARVQPQTDAERRRPQAEEPKPQAASPKPEPEDEPEVAEDAGLGQETGAHVPEKPREVARTEPVSKEPAKVEQTPQKVEPPVQRPEPKAEVPKAKEPKAPAPRPKSNLPRTVDEFLHALKQDAATDYWKSLLGEARHELKDGWPELCPSGFPGDDGQARLDRDTQGTAGRSAGWYRGSREAGLDLLQALPGAVHLPLSQPGEIRSHRRAQRALSRACWTCWIRISTSRSGPRSRAGWLRPTTSFCARRSRNLARRTCSGCGPGSSS